MSDWSGASYLGSRGQGVATITACLNKFNNYMDNLDTPDKSRCYAVFPRTRAWTEVGQLGRADDHLRGPMPSRRSSAFCQLSASGTWYVRGRCDLSELPLREGLTEYDVVRGVMFAIPFVRFIEHI
jgi:hypothetical protein